VSSGAFRVLGLSGVEHAVDIISEWTFTPIRFLDDLTQPMPGRAMAMNGSYEASNAYLKWLEAVALIDRRRISPIRE
jgi:hypothetical protein